MATTNFTTSLKLALPTTGDLVGTWGDAINNSITTLLDTAVAGNFPKDMAALGTDWTLTSNNGATDEARYAVLIPYGNTGATRSIFAPKVSKTYIIINKTNASVIIRGGPTSPTTGVTIATGATVIVAWDSNLATPDFVAITPASISGVVPVANGGTGASSAATARTNLGATTVGGNVYTLTNPSAITFPRFNADNTVSALNAADFRTAIGAGSGAGSVTSVAMSVPTFLTVTGSPIVGAGTLAVTLSGTALPVANGGTGSTSTTYCSLTTNVTDTLPVGNGGTGSTTLTANNVLLGNGTSAPQAVAPSTSGNVLTSNGTTWVSSAPAGGGMSNIAVVTSTSTWTVPAGVTKIKVYVCGGGGGGNGYGSGGYYGSGGGGAGTSVRYYTVTPASTASITIGSGGAVGVTGGTSSFVYSGVTVSGNGGVGAIAAANAGGKGGIGSGGSFVIPGVAGQTGQLSYAGGPGGSSFFGRGGVEGSSAELYGAGGNGGYGTGAAGTSGVVVIEY
jgi:hypothetical protein